MSARQLRATLRSIRRRGLPPDVVRQLERWGFRPASINAARRLVPTNTSLARRAPLGMILRPKFAASLLSFATGLDQYIRELSQDPVS
jgi:hypothetical protein